MDCEQFRGYWVLILDGTLDPIHAYIPTVEIHYNECASCQAWHAYARAMALRDASTEEGATA